MSSIPEAQFTEFFAVPFLQYQWPDNDNLNSELRTVILTQQRAVAGRMTWPGSSIGGRHSGKDLKAWPQPCVKELLNRIDVMTRDMVKRLVSRPQTDHFEHWSVRAWANVSHHGHRNRSYDHSGECRTLWSGIYYVDPGEQPGQAESGLAVFEDWSGVPKEIICNPNPFEREFTIQPVPGLMVMFPGRFRHRVELYHGHAPRITVAFNLGHPGFLIPSYQMPGEKGIMAWMWKNFRGLMVPARRLKKVLKSSVRQ